MKRPGVAGFLTSVVAVGVALVAAEVGLRLLYPVEYREPPTPRPDNVWRETLHRRSSIPGLSYELAPDKKKFSHGARIRTNSHGMRDDEPMSGDDVRRLAAVGDSFTFGFGVPERDAYPAVLQRLLNARESALPFRVDVLNFGVGGYSTRDEAIVVEHKVLPWKPTTVILGYFLNDPEIRPIQPLHSYFHEPEWWQHSHVLRLLAQGKKDFDVRRHGGGDYRRFLHTREAEWSSVEEAFAKIGGLARREGFEVVLVIFSAFDDPWDEYPYADLHAKVAEEGRANGFHVFDTQPMYAQHDPLDLRVGEENRHPNGFAHSLLADELRTMLLERVDLFFGDGASSVGPGDSSASSGGDLPRSSR